MNAIMSIKPCFCELIFSRWKQFEYRRRVFKRLNVDKVYIYASKPICKIVGYFTIECIIRDTPSEVWRVTHKDGGISKQQFDEYFKGRDIAYAIAIDEAVKLDEPIDPKQVIKNFKAPQNFIYLEKDL